MPEWEKEDTFDGWKRRIQRWADNNAKPERKAEMLLASLKKNSNKVGFVKAEFEENSAFDFYNRNVVEKMLRAIEEFVEESKFSRVAETVKEFCSFERKDDESPKSFISRFTALKSKLKNVDAGMTNTWLSGFLLEKSKLSVAEKNNILATLNVENENHVLKDLEKKIKDIEWNGKTVSKETVDSFYGYDRKRSNSQKDESRDRQGRSGSRGRNYSQRNFNRSRSRGRNEKEDSSDTRRTFHVTAL